MGAGAMADTDDETGSATTVSDDISADSAGPTLTGEMRLLAANAKAMAQAEIAYQRSRAAYAGSKVRIIAILSVSAACLIFFAVMAAVVGTVIALAPLLGGWAAMIAVSGSLLAIVAVLGIIIALHVRQMKTVLTDKADDE